MTDRAMILCVVRGDNGHIDVEQRFAELEELRDYLHQSCQQLGLALSGG